MYKVPNVAKIWHFINCYLAKEILLILTLVVWFQELYESRTCLEMKKIPTGIDEVCRNFLQIPM